MVKFPLPPFGSGRTVMVGVAVAGVDPSLDVVATLVLIWEAVRLRLVVPAGGGDEEVGEGVGNVENGMLESEGLEFASVGTGV